MTILFRDDWKKYPRAIIDDSTQNESFIRLAEIYYKLGVKNNAFMLSLKNPELKDVDPFSPDLDDRTQLMVFRECVTNFWYYLREIARVDVSGRPEPIHFGVNRSNLALYWLYLNHVTTINIVIRQTGKTTGFVTLAEWLLNFALVKADIGLLTKDNALRTETMKGVKEQLTLLPDYLNLTTRTDTFNSEQILMKGTENQLLGLISNASEKDAEKTGRGFTIGTVLGDEVAYINHIRAALGALSFSGNQARTVLREAGLPYGTTLATTAGNVNDRDGGYIFGLLSSATLFTEKMFDCDNEKHLNDFIFKNSNARNNKDRKPIVNLTMSYRQMGKDEKWMREKLSEVVSSEENINRDLFNRWTTGSNDSPIDPRYKDVIYDSLQEDPRIDIFAPYDYALRWYITKEEFERRSKMGHFFIVGIDTSDGSGRDDISFYVRDQATGEIVCGALFNEINLITLAGFFAEFSLRYKNSLIVIERQSSAITIIDHIITKFVSLGVNPFKRMYNTIFQHKEIYEKEFKEIWEDRCRDDRTFIKYKKHLGFKTIGGEGLSSRSELYGTTFQLMVRYTAHLMRNKALIDQILSLIIKNGRVDHPVGATDDAVIAAILSMWFLINGRNMHLYGIDPHLTLKKNDVYLRHKFNDQEEGFDQEEAESVENEINKLMDAFRSERNKVIQDQLERRIMYLSKDLTRSTGSVTVTEMLDNIKKDKRLRIRAR